MNFRQRKRLERLLKQGERLDMSGFPWPCPKEGDLVRAECLLDDDPQNVTGRGWDSIHKAVSNCRIRRVEPSANPGLTCVCFDDIDNLPFPLRYSKSEYTGKYGEWGGVDFWAPDRPAGDFVPLHAIKKSLLHDYAQQLKRRAERADLGMF